MQRPQRIRIKNESGKLQSLPDGTDYFQDLGGNGEILFLGLGPVPETALKLFPDSTTIHYIECPDFESQTLSRKIPSVFKKIRPKQLSTTAHRIILYTPNKILFPSFWGPILAQLVIRQAGVNKRVRKKTVWIPGDDNSLLIPELSKALAHADFTYSVIDPDAMRKNLLSMLDQELPELVLSINFIGLDNTGETYFMLREAGVKVVVWFVDNPFHILSGIKSDYWKQVPLMVTDHWFIQHLKRLGSTKIEHLPLGTDPGLFNADVVKFPMLDNRVVFVGRSSFPNKDNFFAGCTFTQKDYDDAVRIIETGAKPDFEWWANRDMLYKFWPGRAVRETGFRAEQSGLLWRSCILDAAGENLTLFGDEGWKKQLTSTDIRPPVDYYTALPSIYAGAGINLNMTSPLLPCGLTQRNFDVWAVGGFLLTDYTSGLSIFPEELVQECSFTSPDEIPALCDKFMTRPNLMESLSKFWRNIILKKHTYYNRITNLLNFIQ